jgi:hypothetical protein
LSTAITAKGRNAHQGADFFSQLAQFRQISS